MEDQEKTKEQLLSELDRLSGRLSEVMETKRVLESMLREGEDCKFRMWELERANEGLSVALEEIAASNEEIRLQNEELVKAQESIQRERERYRTLFEFAPDGSLVTDIYGTITEANRAAETLFGLSRERLLGIPLANLIAEEDRSELRTRLFGLRDGSDIQRWEIKLGSKNGATLHVAVSVIPVKLAGEKETMLRWLFRDISQQTAMAEELKRSNRDLEDFASIASHDMHEPLRKVMSFGNILKQNYGDVLGQEGLDYLDRMLNATMRMQQLLDSLLDYSRIATRAEPFVEVDLNRIAREAVSDLEVRIQQEKGLVDIENLSVIEVRPSQMHQLFLNLVGNSLKFHKQGVPPIIKIRDQMTDDGLLQIFFEDNGIGFDEEHLERIFAPFQRLHGRHEYEGSGMGLAICKKIVERHGGSITARSTPGEGSTFIVTLPVKQDSSKNA